MIYLFFFVAVLVIFIAIYFSIGSKDETHPERRLSTVIGENSKQVFCDIGNKKPFKNKAFMIIAKPDFIYRTKVGEYIVIEYKSRAGKVYPSDISQTLASCLAVRSKYPVSKAIIYTRGGDHRVIELESDQEIFAKIHKHYQNAVNAKLNQEPLKTGHSPCKICGYGSQNIC